jgi:hypothetical protein
MKRRELLRSLVGAAALAVSSASQAGFLLNSFSFPAAAAGPTSTQWRFLFPSGPSSTAAASSAVSIYEGEMRATTGGANLCTGGTASASSVLDGNRPASQAFNGSTSGFPWASTAIDGIGSWLKYTFASAVTVNEFALYCATTEYPTSVRLQYYDGSQWVTHIAADGPLTWSVAGWQTFTYAAPFVENAGYVRWRLNIVTGCTGTYMNIAECEMRGSIGGADRCFGITATATNSLDGNRTPAKAFDNLSGGGNFPWVPGSPTNGTGTSLEVIFFRPELIRQVVLTYGGDANSSPQAVNLDYYDPGTSSWVTYWSMSPSAWTANGQTFTASGP